MILRTPISVFTDRGMVITLSFGINSLCLPTNIGGYEDEKNKAYYFLVNCYRRYFAVVFQSCHSRRFIFAATTTNGRKHQRQVDDDPRFPESGGTQ